MPHSPYTCVLWDVDGTIADATPGIFPRLIEVLASFDLPAPDPASMGRWVGPPMYESFQQLAGLSPDDAAEALTRYRALAARDGYAASVDIYPGVPDVIRAVAAAGIPQATASTKPENQVRAILEHNGLVDLFTALSGARTGAIGRSDSKSDVIGWALERLEAAGVDTSRPVLIGDRHHDVDGAAEFGIPVIFSEWGFGEDAEGDPATFRAADAAALQALLLQDDAA
ncbi:phosphoglycolate phosphatase [Microbacterium ginsengiterrae]|uniref:Phosphoglycolate phosphatase n=1 Tax=Microbacterium ginsengiterrae TaxID=546115 RepID=A0A7W9CBX1_9MICO|nr:HAD hydrolase-like protein [Microbacterium ginsengiterrae]MBB5742763.1 phosphoglycolate phosphatase [Microbacterium ginsengiterrae]